MKKFLIIFLYLIAFVLSVNADEIASSEYFLKEINNYLIKYQCNINSANKNYDKDFYNLQKSYENLVFMMNTNNVDNISDIRCRTINGKYKLEGNVDSTNFNIQKYTDIGLGFYCTEAMSVFIVNYNWLEKHYGRKLTKEYKFWLKYLKQPVPFEEGMLNTNKKNLKKQIKNLETFISTHPDFIGINDIKNELNKLKNAQ